MDITIKWGKERFHYLTNPNYTKLRLLRQFVADQTHLDIGAFKLIFSGGVMRDDDVLLDSYGLSQGSIITVIGSLDKPLHGPSARRGLSELKTEQSLMLTIQNELNAVNHSLRPAVDSFLQLNAPSGSDFDAEHRRLGELLLQSLLRLDALSPETHWTEARTRRKQAVKQIQAMLSELDKSAEDGRKSSR